MSTTGYLRNSIRCPHQTDSAHAAPASPLTLLGGHTMNGRDERHSLLWDYSLRVFRLNSYTGPSLRLWL